MAQGNGNAERKFLGVKDIQNIFNIGREKAIALIKSDGFPVIKIGRTYRIDSSKLEDWITEHEGQTVVTEKRNDIT